MSTYSNDFNNSLNLKYKKSSFLKNVLPSHQMSVLQTNSSVHNHSSNDDSNKKFNRNSFCILNLNSPIKSSSNTSNMLNEPVLCYGKMKSKL